MVQAATAPASASAAAGGSRSGRAGQPYARFFVDIAAATAAQDYPGRVKVTPSASHARFPIVRSAFLCRRQPKIGGSGSFASQHLNVEPPYLFFKPKPAEFARLPNDARINVDIFHHEEDL